MSERARHLHATAEAQIGELIKLVSGVDDATLHRLYGQRTLEQAPARCCRDVVVRRLIAGIRSSSRLRTCAWLDFPPERYG